MLFLTAARAPERVPFYRRSWPLPGPRPPAAARHLGCPPVHWALASISPPFKVITKIIEGILAAAESVVSRGVAA